MKNANKSYQEMDMNTITFVAQFVKVQEIHGFIRDVS